MSNDFFLNRSYPRIACYSALLWLVSCAAAASARAADDAKPKESDAAAVFSVEAAAHLDSEQALVQRREQRLAQLPAPPAPPQVDLPAAAANPIDQFIIAAWQTAGLEAAKKPPALCDDAAFARRAFLDLIGVIPTPLEVNRFLADHSPQKRGKLVDQLMARRAEYAAHWTPFWEDALASQPVLGQGGIPTRGNYRDWLLASFEHNRPYDVMVAELIDPTMPGRRREVDEELIGTRYAIGYVRNEDHRVTLQTAANVGQVFLGTSMKCASCHDHFENQEWSQERFLAFAGLFAPRDLERIRCDAKTGQFVPARFPFELPGAPRHAPSVVEARLQLAAQLLVDPLNPRFAKTIVNRLWKRYLGLGLVEPADDLRLDSPASHPELLDWLAYDFVAHGCDLQHTIRLILTSRTYQLQYDAALEDHLADPNSAEQGESAPRYFRSPSLRRLSAEQVFDSVRLAMTARLRPDDRLFLDGRSTALMRALGRPSSRNEISTSRSDGLAVVQSLELLNGPELEQLIELHPLLAKPPTRGDPRRLVDQLYQSVLSRHATPDEKRLGKEFLDGAGSLADGLHDMLWALVCSAEFQYVK
ncbi:MAG TPA: DUF1549 and DUF1553 domain-containing protein [Pirellulales bacterium]|nr:DUF1549 and DUF1553 domain-containing protein [Pirellulales bacterium]